MAKTKKFNVVIEDELQKRTFASNIDGTNTRSIFNIACTTISTIVSFVTSFFVITSTGIITAISSFALVVGGFLIGFIAAAAAAAFSFITAIAASIAGTIATFGLGFINLFGGGARLARAIKRGSKFANEVYKKYLKAKEKLLSIKDRFVKFVKDDYARFKTNLNKIYEKGKVWMENNIAKPISERWNTKEFAPMRRNVGKIREFEIRVNDFIVKKIGSVEKITSGYWLQQEKNIWKSGYDPARRANLYARSASGDLTLGRITKLKMNIAGVVNKINTKINNISGAVTNATTSIGTSIARGVRMFGRTSANYFSSTAKYAYDLSRSGIMIVKNALVDSKIGKLISNSLKESKVGYVIMSDSSKTSAAFLKREMSFKGLSTEFKEGLAEARASSAGTKFIGAKNAIGDAASFKMLQTKAFGKVFGKALGAPLIALFSALDYVGTQRRLSAEGHGDRASYVGAGTSAGIGLGGAIGGMAILGGVGAGFEVGATAGAAVGLAFGGVGALPGAVIGGIIGAGVVVGAAVGTIWASGKLGDVAGEKMADIWSTDKSDVSTPNNYGPWDKALTYADRAFSWVNNEILIPTMSNLEAGFGITTENDKANAKLILDYNNKQSITAVAGKDKSPEEIFNAKIAETIATSNASIVSFNEGIQSEENVKKFNEQSDYIRGIIQAPFYDPVKKTCGIGETIDPAFISRKQYEVQSLLLGMGAPFDTQVFITETNQGMVFDNSQEGSIENKQITFKHEIDGRPIINRRLSLVRAWQGDMTEHAQMIEQDILQRLVIADTKLESMQQMKERNIAALKSWVRWYNSRRGRAAREKASKWGVSLGGPKLESESNVRYMV